MAPKKKDQGKKGNQKGSAESVSKSETSPKPTTSSEPKYCVLARSAKIDEAVVSFAGGPEERRRMRECREQLENLPKVTLRDVPVQEIPRWMSTILELKPIEEQFPDGNYPIRGFEGIDEITSMNRITEEEKREEKRDETKWQDFRRAAEAHRQVRKYIDKFIKPNVTTLEICKRIEEAVKQLIQSSKTTNVGLPYPVECALNHLVCHTSPITGDNTVLTYDDICKVDFGIQVNGHIVSSGYTKIFNNDHDELIKVAREATELAINATGVDVRFSEIAKKVNEFVESSESYKVQRSIWGHSMEDFFLFGDKQIEMGSEGITNTETRMMENEVYKIQVCVSDGDKEVGDEKHDPTTEYRRIFLLTKEGKLATPRDQIAAGLLKDIDSNFSPWRFCTRWTDARGYGPHVKEFKYLIDKGFLKSYPRVQEKPGTHNAKFGHTVLLGSNSKEVVTRGEDY